MDRTYILHSGMIGNRSQPSFAQSQGLEMGGHFTAKISFLKAKHTRFPPSFLVLVFKFDILNCSVLYLFQVLLILFKR